MICAKTVKTKETRSRMPMPRGFSLKRPVRPSMQFFRGGPSLIGLK